MRTQPESPEALGGRSGTKAALRGWRAWPRRHARRVRWGVLAAIFLAGLTLFPRQAGYRAVVYRPGTVLAKPIIAEFDFPVNKDPQQLQQEQDAAMAAVPPVFVLHDSVAVSALAMLESVEPTAAAAEREGARDRLREYLERGIVTAQQESQLAGTPRVTLVVRGADWIGPSERFVGPARLRREREAAPNAEARRVAQLVERCAQPNVSADEPETERRRALARDTVDPTFGMVLKGEEILGAHKRIWPEDLRKLESYEAWRLQRSAHLLFRERLWGFLGRSLLLALAIAAITLFVRAYRRVWAEDLNDVLLLGCAACFSLLIGGIVLNVLRLSPYLIPISAFAVLLTLLYEERLALAGSAWLATVVGLLTDVGLDFVIVLGLGSVVAVMSVRHLQDRRQLYRLLLFVPIVHLVTLGALGLMRSTPLEALISDGLYLVANPFLAVGIALFAVPLSEVIFGRSTNLALLELLDLNRPLLRRLMLEAPGTYHHSLMVGTLAETGAARVGADPLLARVIGYHHDIGKLSKPEYFVENLVPGRKNPHDKLTPTMSRLLLESHVRDGVRLAREWKLPRAVCDGIAQHHANGLMAYFYHKARQKDPQTPESEYRYPGPLPRTPEAGIVLLADQIDAASRSLENPTPSRLRGLVKQLIDRRIQEGELDETQLTLQDLAALREAFVPILTALFIGRRSGRVGYPTTEATRG